MEKEKTLLAIESSCDETAASLVRFSESKNQYEIEVLSNVVASQIDLHKKWGGVYPELASRAHLEAIMPVIDEAMEPLGERGNTLSKLKQIDSIAVTKEPGLIGSLLVGIGAAKILGAYFDKPVENINHLAGHIYSGFCADNPNLKHKIIIPKDGIFPILALVVSGGHTSLVLMQDHLEYETVGQTIDDAAGEAFDKVARTIGLGYPGGPEIEKVAKLGDENKYQLPLSMKNSGDLNFSFSGLKTAVLYLTKDPRTKAHREYDQADLAASFQKTVTEILIGKTLKAVEKYNPKTVILSGGVSANGYLRERFVQEIDKLSLRGGTTKQSCNADPSTSGLDRNARDDIGISDCHGHRSGLAMTQVKSHRPINILIPPKNLSTDNAVGIAIAGAIQNS